jgi:arsenite methyltransferase
MDERTRNDEVRQAVREHYGRAAASATPVSCAPGCCAPQANASEKLGYSAEELSSLPEGADLGFGCGNPNALASLRRGEVVLDLGSGAGIDAFLAAKQVGPDGHVIGIDMTPEMISRARENAAKAGALNVEFRLGEIEHLPVADASVDVILSNCVINLVPDKRAALREAFRVLKPGGRLAIADVVQTAPLPPELRDDVVSLVGCIAGAASVSDLKEWLASAGFSDVRIEERPGSREIVKAWMDGVENYVASAEVRATKPGSSACCAPDCCQ